LARLALKVRIPPPDTRWSELSKKQTAAANQKYWGEVVWKFLLSEGMPTSADYETLCDLGVKYQLLAQTIALAEMSAWADQDSGTGRLAVNLEVCFLLWTGSFLIGRFFGNADLPKISCSD
jgi:hypothetical protein